MPRIRCRSGAISCTLPGETCPCGAIPTAEIARIRRRADDMIILGTGENAYASRFDEILVPIEHLWDYCLTAGKAGYQDTLLLQVETDAPSAGLRGEVIDRLYRGLSCLRHDVEESRAIAGPAVEVVAPGTLVRPGAFKAWRLVDSRS